MLSPQSYLTLCNPMVCIPPSSSVHGVLQAGILEVKWSEVKVTQSCPTLWGPMDYTVHGILQARVLEWELPFSKGSSQPRDAGGFFTSWATGILEGVAISSSGGSSWPGELNLCLLHVLCWQVDTLPLIHLIWKPKSLHSDNFIFFSFLTLTQWFHREIFFPQMPRMFALCPLRSTCQDEIKCVKI